MLVFQLTFQVSIDAHELGVRSCELVDSDLGKLELFGDGADLVLQVDDLVVLCF
jgi:hypothetical protein